MSYILDALKKSEERRNNGKVLAPSFHAQPRPLKKTTYYLLPVAAAIVLALLLIAGLYFFKNDNEGSLQTPLINETIIENQASHQPTITAVKKEITEPELKNNSPAISKSISNASEKKHINDAPFNDELTSFNAQSTSNIGIQTKPEPIRNNEKATKKLITSKPENIVNLYESPSHLKKQIPGLDYSSHWHDKNPARSVIIINNKSYKEGGWINNKIKVESILQDETIFKIDNDRFKLSSLQSWGI